MTPTLRQLEYLVAVARELNFRKAAEACSVSQPSLSAQIQQLESLLGIQLFERDRRGVRATPAGEALARRAEAVLAQVQDLEAAAQAFHRPLTGRLRLGAIPTMAPYLLPRAVPAVRQAWPELQLLLREEQTHACLESLLDGRMDVALLALEAELGDVHVVPLFRDPFVAVVPADHPLAGESTVGEDQLLAERLLLLEEGHCLRSQVLEACRRRDAEDDLDVFEATSLTTLVQMVAMGLGVTLVPEMARPVELAAAEGVVAVPLADPAPFRTVGLAWRPSSPRDREFSLLADVLEPLGG